MLHHKSRIFQMHGRELAATLIQKESNGWLCACLPETKIGVAERTGKERRVNTEK